MATSAVKAWGLVLTFDGVTIGEITSLNGTRIRNTIDVFSCDSADEAVERLTSGLDEGTPTFGFVWQPGAAENYDVLNDKYLQGLKSTLLITTATPAGATAPTLSVQALITSLSYPNFGSAREILMGEVGFQTSGKVTYTDSSGSSVSASPSASVSSSTSA
jgi:hypothetical protein